MSKAKKGTRMGLGDFYKAAGGNDDDQLPSGPSGIKSDDPRGGTRDRWDRTKGGDEDRGDRGDRGRGDREDRPRREPEEDMPSRADEADQWRRVGDAPRDAPRRGGFGDRDRDRGFGDRDRERGFGDRDRERDRGFDDRDRDRERGGFGRGFDRDRPREDDPRDRRDRDADFGRSDGADQWRRSDDAPRRPAGGFGRGFGDRDRDRGFGDRDRDRGFGDRDRGFGDRDRDRGYGDRDRDRGFGDRNRGFGDRDRERSSFGSSFGRRDDRDRRDDDRFRDREDDRDRDRDRPRRDDDREPRRDREDSRDKSKEDAEPEEGAAGKEEGAGDAAKKAEDALADRFEQSARVEEDKPKSEEPAAPKVIKSKKLDPNAKVDPFGGAARPAAAAPAPADNRTEEEKEKDKETQREAAKAKLAGMAERLAKRKEEEASSRYGDRDRDRYGAGDRYGDRDRPRYGDRFGGRDAPSRDEDTRPDRLRRNVAPDTLNEEAFPTLGGKPKAESTPAGKADASADKEPKEKKKTALELALEDASGSATVSDSELTEGLTRYDVPLAKPEARAKFAALLATSMAEGSLDFKTVSAAVIKKSQFHSSAVLSAALENYKTKKGEPQLKKLVKDSGVDILKVLPGLAQNAALSCLKPGASSDNEIATAITEGKSADEVKQMVENRLGGEEKTALAVVESVSVTLFKEVFSNKINPKLELLDKYKAVLELLGADVPSQVKVVTGAQIAWGAAGCPKSVLTPVLKRLNTIGIVSPEGFLEWKDDMDSKRDANKSKALLQVMAFINEMEAQVGKDDEYDDEDGAGYDDDDDPR